MQEYVLSNALFCSAFTSMCQKVSMKTVSNKYADDNNDRPN